MKRQKHCRGYYEKERLKMFLINNPWPYRGKRWRKMKQTQTRVLCDHIIYETKNILIGGNEIHTVCGIDVREDK